MNGQSYRSFARRASVALFTVLFWSTGARPDDPADHVLRLVELPSSASLLSKVLG